MAYLPERFDWRSHARGVSEFRLETAQEAIEHFLLTQPLHYRGGALNARRLLFAAHAAAYSKPTRDDTAVICSFFNYTNSAKLLENFCAFRARLRDGGVPNYAIELALTGEPRQTDAEFFLESPSALFYKESLWEALSRRVPLRFSKLVFVDADIIFSAPDWVDRCSVALDSADVIQPMSRAAFLGYGVKHSAAASLVASRSVLSAGADHPGFALGVTRKWLGSAGLPAAIFGSGDSIFWRCIAQLHGKHYGGTLATSRFYEKEIARYSERLSRHPPRVGCLEGVTAIHLPHGSREKRRYHSRYDLFDSAYLETMSFTRDGLPYWPADHTASRAAIEYFRSRDEDGPPETSARLSRAWSEFDQSRAVAAWVVSGQGEDSLSRRLIEIGVDSVGVTVRSETRGGYAEMLAGLLKAHPLCELFLLFEGDAALLCGSRGDLWRRVVYGMNEDLETHALLCHGLSPRQFRIGRDYLFHSKVYMKENAARLSHGFAALTREAVARAAQALRSQDSPCSLTEVACWGADQKGVACLINNLTRSRDV